MKLILSFFFILFSFSALSQTAEDSVKAAISQLFTAMRHADSVLLKASFTDRAILH